MIFRRCCKRWILSNVMPSTLSRTKIFTAIFKRNGWFKVCLFSSCVNKESYHQGDFHMIEEGKAELFYPVNNILYYNTAHVLMHDLSIAGLQTYINNYNGKRFPEKIIEKPQKNGIDILDALAEAGLRSIRYALEVSGIHHILTNDGLRTALVTLKKNVDHNRVSDVITLQNRKAVWLMHEFQEKREQFDVVDLNPGQGPAQFIDATVQSVEDGGLLMLTCTDLNVLSGHSNNACITRYGAVAINSSFKEELVLRILLQFIDCHAARFSRYIIPLLSYGTNSFIRLFILVKNGKDGLKLNLSKRSLVYQCTRCEMFHLQPLHIYNSQENKIYRSLGLEISSHCSYCDIPHQIAGPIWSGQLHDKDFITNIISFLLEEPDYFQTTHELLTTLRIMLEELDDCPLYFTLDKLCGLTRIKKPKVTHLKSTLINLGHRVSGFHNCNAAVKTDAPFEIILKIIKNFNDFDI